MDRTSRHQLALIVIAAIVTALVATTITAPFSIVAGDIISEYGGTVVNGDVNARVKFSRADGSILNEADSPNIIVRAFFTSYPDYSWMELGGVWLCDVTYKASWENQSRTIYHWSYNSPETKKDDDPHPQSAFSYIVDLRNSPIGPQQIDVTVSGVGYATNVTHWFIYTVSGSSSIHFTVAGAPPAIDVISPENKEYNTNSIPLVFYTKEGTPWLGYSLDNLASVTIHGNTTLTGLSDGYHIISVYANGVKWNTGKSSDVLFKVNAQQGGNNSIPILFWKTNVTWDLSETPARDLWETDIEAESRSWTTPTVFDGIVYAGLTSSLRLSRYGGPQVRWINVYAFNATTGATIWEYLSNSSDQISNLAVVDGVVYFGGGGSGEGYTDPIGNRITGGVYALNASSGTLLWKAPLNNIGQSSPAVVDDVVYIGGEKTVYALNAANGDVIWNTTIGSNVGRSSPAVANGRVYIGSFEGVHALDAVTGDRIWDYYGEDFHGTGIVAERVVYASSSGANIYAFDAFSGAKIWNYSLGDEYHTGASPIAIINNMLYATLYAIYSWAPSELYALNAKNGAKIWNVTLGYKISAPKIVNDVVCLSSDASLLILSADTGETLWNYTMGVGLGEPVVANGAAYLSAGDQIYGIGLPSFPPAAHPINEPFPVVLVAVVVVAVAVSAGLLLYFKKRKH